MHPSHPLLRFLADRGRRSVSACLGLVVASFGVYLQMQANIGLAPWTALSQGLHLQLPITFGTASILSSLAIIAGDLLLREPIGLGTVLDALVVGWVMDLFLLTDPVPLQTALPLQLLVLFAGTAVNCFGTFLYMRTGLSCGPRDAFLVAVGKRFPRVSIGAVNIALLAAATAAAALLGCPPGPGTLITVLSVGPIMDLVFRLCRFEPRDVDHEDFPRTWAALLAAAREARRTAGL